MTLKTLRTLLLPALGALATGLPAWASANELRFDVFLGESRIGTHAVSIETRGDERRVRVTADMAVRLLFFNAFEYQHTAKERWRGDCIAELETETNDDGESLTVNARSLAADGAVSRLEVVATGERQVIEGCVRTFAYWDPQLLDSGFLLNTQTGEYKPASLERVGNEPMRFGERVLGAKQYRLQVADEVAIDLWYTPDDRWVALETTVSGGNVLRYLRRDTES